jgi:hypothetical protein
MEIHAPHGPVVTWKEAAIHLAIVTVGIVIALSFEGLLEWSHHRNLVREAKTNLTTEIRQNQKELDRFMAKLPSMAERFRHGLAILNDLPTQRQEAAELFRAGSTSVMYGFDLAELRTASRTTAEITGAFGLMDYRDAEIYAAVYDRQQLFTRTQNQAVDNGTAAFALGQSLDFGKPSPDELEGLKRQLRLTIGSLSTEEEFARALKTAVARALEQLQ